LAFVLVVIFKMYAKLKKEILIWMPALSWFKN